MPCLKRWVSELQQRLKIKKLQRKSKFDSDFKALPMDIQREAKEAIKDLMKDPIPASRRRHPLTGFKNPKVYTIDVLSNHAYKISLEISGESATLRRIGTRSTIDRCP